MRTKKISVLPLFGTNNLIPDISSKLIEMRFVLLLLLRNDFAHFTKIAITPVWDLIETWGFREDLPLVFPHDPR